VLALGAGGGAAAEPFELVVSLSPDRSNPAALEGATASGDIYVFTRPDDGVTRVRFYLDDPARSGPPLKTETNGPFDLAGTVKKSGLAIPFDTTTIADGAHTVTAALDVSGGGTQVVSAAFTVANGNEPPPPPPPPPSDVDLLLSGSPDRSSPAPLEGSALVGPAYIFTGPDTGVSQVSFFLDDPTMSGSARKIENGAPFDFAGSASNGLANPFDTTTVADGFHSITASVKFTDGRTSVVTRSFTVANEGEPPPPPPPPGDLDVFLSGSPDRSSPAPLEGSALVGPAYIFTGPDTGVSQVSFYLDDPTMSRSPRKIEKGAPFDFAGSASNGLANPFDTTTVADGPHSITASVKFADGRTSVVTRTFTVANAGPVLTFTPASVALTTQPGGQASALVDLAVTTQEPLGFSVSDGSDWLTVSPSSGTVPVELRLDVDADGLSVGSYQATVEATAAGAGSASLGVMLTVSDPSGTPRVPDQVHLAWSDDPSTTLTVVWRTLDPGTPSAVEYRASGESEWLSAGGAIRPSGTTGALHEALLAPLEPGTTYDYRVLGDGGAWSPVFTARTAPLRGPADFDAVYVADTGIVGRADALTTGTQQVIDEIAALRPTVVLLGGDYAYYNTETRFGTLDAAIDAWFNQMQPIGTSSPMMVSYGNHEILLSEGFAPWAARFPTPAGHDDRRHYSFDIGDVHFVSILAVSETGGLSSSTLSWIENDVNAARAAGARWIVPFFHVAPFSDGKNHPSNLTLRGQLGPLFERLGVKVAIASHDQSYERTYPLTDVPDTNAPTTLRKRCYTQADGVTWVKVSPGGKLSNKNGSFSVFATNPQPAWTAFRDNTRHHFLRLLVSASGTLTTQVYGLAGDGSPAVIIDEFTYTLDVCAPELALAPETVDLSVDPENPQASKPVGVSTSDGQAAAVLSSASSWLTASPASVTTPGTAQVMADGTGLTAGTYTATLTAAAAGFVSSGASVTLTVHDLLVSQTPDRAAPDRLRGSTLVGDAYIFVPGASNVKQVRFWLDNPSMSGSPRKVEKSPPFDFAGTATDGSALLFDTDRISDGTHTISAALDLTDGGTYELHGTFTIDND